MKRIGIITTVMALFACACSNNNTSGPKAVLWPDVENSVKAYAKSKGGTYYSTGSWGTGDGTVLSNFGILIPCREAPMKTQIDSMREVIEAAGGSGSGHGGGYTFPSRESPDSEIILVGDTSALRAERWGSVGDAFMHVVGRVVVPKEMNGGIEYEVLKRGLGSSKPTPEGALVWLKIDYINQNAPKQRND